MKPIERIQLAIDASFNAPFHRTENQEAKAALQELIDMEWPWPDSVSDSVATSNMYGNFRKITEDGVKAMLKAMMGD